MKNCVFIYRIYLPTVFCVYGSHEFYRWGKITAVFINVKILIIGKGATNKFHKTVMQIVFGLHSIFGLLSSRNVC